MEVWKFGSIFSRNYFLILTCLLNISLCSQMCSQGFLKITARVLISALNRNIFSIIFKIKLIICYENDSLLYFYYIVK